jgi:hypothetical protein
MNHFAFVQTTTEWFNARRTIKLIGHRRDSSQMETVLVSHGGRHTRARDHRRRKSRGLSAERRGDVARDLLRGESAEYAIRQVWHYRRPRDPGNALRAGLTVVSRTWVEVTGASGDQDRSGKGPHGSDVDAGHPAERG